MQILGSLEVPAALLIAHSLLRLPAFCVPVPQGPFPQPLSGPRTESVKKLPTALKDLGEKESIPRSFLFGSKKISFHGSAKKAFPVLLPQPPPYTSGTLSSKPSCAGVTDIFLSPPAHRAEWHGLFADLCSPRVWEGGVSSSLASSSCSPKEISTSPQPLSLAAFQRTTERWTEG